MKKPTLTSFISPSILDWCWSVWRHIGGDSLSDQLCVAAIKSCTGRPVQPLTFVSPSPGHRGVHSSTVCYKVSCRVTWSNPISSHCLTVTSRVSGASYQVIHFLRTLFSNVWILLSAAQARSTFLICKEDR